MPCPTRFFTAFAFAHPFLEVCGDIVMAWMLLWRARIRRKRLAAGAKEKTLFSYEGQIKSVEFFTHTILPVTFGKMKAILDATAPSWTSRRTPSEEIDRPDEKRRGGVSRGGGRAKSCPQAPPTPIVRNRYSCYR